jgi:hypothetical protein
MIGIDGYEVEFIRALHAEAVRFLVVGGRAVRFYRPARITTDLDILVGFEGENLAAAMSAMGRVDPRYFRKTLGAGATRPGIQAPVELQGRHADVLTSIAGVDFEAAWKSRITIVEQGLELNVISVDDLIENKRAQDDAKGMADLALLLDVSPR